MIATELIDIEYIRPNRAMETYLLKNTNKKDEQKVVYVYNYEGYHYRLFNSIVEVANFLCGEPYQVIKDFDNEEEVDEFFQQYNFFN